MEYIICCVAHGLYDAMWPHGLYDAVWPHELYYAVWSLGLPRPVVVSL